MTPEEKIEYLKMLGEVETSITGSMYSALLREEGMPRPTLNKIRKVLTKATEEILTELKLTVDGTGEKVESKHVFHCPICKAKVKGLRSPNWAMSYKQGEVEAQLWAFYCKPCKQYFFM